MIVLEINFEDVARLAVFEAKRQPPIAADRHGEGSGSSALQHMKSASATQVSGLGRAVERVENQPHALVKFRSDTARMPGVKDLLHAFVRE